MDQDTYEQFVRVQISLDELKEKMDYLIDEIDELKRAEEPCGDTQEQKEQKERQDQNQIGNKSGAAEGSGSKYACVTRNVLLERSRGVYNESVDGKENSHERK